MLRLPVLLLAVVSSISFAQPASERIESKPQATHPLIGDTVGLDHVLLWSKQPASAETFLRDTLGFRLTAKPGYYGAGISNKLIWFDNASFIEFLWLSDPDLTKKESPNDYAHVTGRGGSNSFGIQVADADDTYTALSSASLHPDKPGGEAYDPDGPEGPKPAVVNRWRFMFLKEGSLPGNPFFVEYNLPEGTPKPRSDQPNGAKALSSVWVLVKDLPGAEAAYSRASFTRSRIVSVPGVGSGIALGAGHGEIFLLRPSEAFRTHLEKYGDHVIGMSIKVDSLDAAKAMLEQKTARKLARYPGPHGPSVRGPTFPALGALIELHE